MPEWFYSAELWILVGFHIFVILMLAIDLGVFQRKAHAVSMREAAIWSTVWVALAVAFGIGIWQYWHLWHPAAAPDEGEQKAIEYFTGYLVEKSLSVDNLFVFLVIFRYFAVPPHLQHRVLFWGIIGALVMRATLILIGWQLLENFHWMVYVFGGFLIYTGYKLLKSVEENIDPGRNPVLRLARRFLPVIDNYDSPRFWVKRDGRWYATPLPLVLLVVETTDVVFAIDSIPAIFGITSDPFIVYTSNIFAILGLRALYFLLANFLGMFRYLNIGLALVLAFVGVKMIAEGPLHDYGYLDAWGVGKRELILFSLAVIATILTVSVVASLIVGPAKPLESLPEDTALAPPPGEPVVDAGTENPEAPTRNP
jgi:tellurite resistance protein TerC